MTGNQYFQIYGEPAVPLPSAEPLFKELNILKLQDAFDLNIAKFIYSTLAGLSPPIFSDWFTYSNSVHSHSTTSAVTITRTEYFDVGTIEPNKTLFTKNSKLVNYGAKMVSVYGLFLWNKLPKKIQESSSVATFKIELKKHFISLYQGNINSSSNNIDNRNTTRTNNVGNPHNNNRIINRNRNRINHRSNLGNNQGLNRPFRSRWEQQQVN